MSFISRILCKHEWKVLDKTVVPSPMEVARNNGAEMSAHSAMQALRAVKETHRLCLTCSKCGALKIQNTSNTDW